MTQWVSATISWRCNNTLRRGETRALRRGHSLSQHTQFLKNNMIARNDFFYETLIQSIETTRLHLARFARAHFALLAHENFRKKKGVSIDSKML